MPRIYAPNEGHIMEWGAVDFINGVAAVAADVDTAFFEDVHKGYIIDDSKHVLTIFDKATREQLEEVCDYIGVTYLPANTKNDLVRLIEGYISAANITALTVASVAGSESGDTKITVANDIGADGNILVYHVAIAAVAPLYKDVLPTTGWTTFTSGSDITAATDKVITVCELNAAREVLSIGSNTVVAKA